MTGSASESQRDDDVAVCKTRIVDRFLTYTAWALLVNFPWVSSINNKMAPWLLRKEAVDSLLESSMN